MKKQREQDKDYTFAAGDYLNDLIDMFGEEENAQLETFKDEE